MPESLISALDEMSQLTCLMVEELAQCDLPLSLYSVLCLSLRSIDFGGALGLEVFSTTPEVGRAFSSCLRNGLRMIGIVAGGYLCCIQVYPRKMLFVGEEGVHNATTTVDRSHSAVEVEIGWVRRLTGSSDLRVVDRGEGKRWCCSCCSVVKSCKG